MPLEVIGAGFGRTGTLSLKFALEKLGYIKCYHMREVLYRGYRATVDWPSCNMWQTHAALYPAAKVILSTRDPDKWYDSVMNTIYKASTAMARSDDPALKRFGEFACDISWRYVFDNRIEDRAYAIGVYNAHVAHVIATLPKSRLLVFDAKEGWEPLCRFLGVPVPDEPYPRVNTTDDFRARNRGRS